MTKRMPKPRNTLKKKPKKRTGPKPTPKGLRQRLDAAFSWYIRLMHSDDKGMLQCFTCKQRLYWTKADNGHFISRRYYATRWRPDNCRPQCKSCNLYNSGEQWLFGKYLDQFYGAGHSERMHEIATKDKNKEPNEEYKKIYIEYYEAKVAAILAKRVKTDCRIRGGVPSRIQRRIRLD